MASTTQSERDLSPLQRDGIQVLGWIDEHAVPLSNVIGSLFMSLGAGCIFLALGNGLGARVFGIGIISIAVGFCLCWWSHIRSNRQTFTDSTRIGEQALEIKELTREITDLTKVIDSHEDYRSKALALSRDLWRTQLHLIFEEAELGTSERISLYSYHSSGPGSVEEFQLFSRYAPDPNHEGMGRIAYPPDQGCLGETWKGEPFFVQLPDPNDDLDKYLEEQKALGLAKTVARKIKMKSREYFGFRIDQDDQNTPLAVVIFESLHADRLDHDHLTSLMNKQRHLARLLKFTQATRPDPVQSRVDDY